MHTNYYTGTEHEVVREEDEPDEEGLITTLGMSRRPQMVS